MTGMIRIFRYELWRHVTRKGYLFMTFGVPVLAIAAYFVISGIQQIQASRPQEDVTKPPPGVNIPGGGLVQTIGVVDLSGTIDSFTSPRLVLYPSEAEAQKALDETKISYYYLIDKDYVTTGNVSMHFERVTLSNIDNAALRRQLIESLVQKSGAEASPDVIKRLQTDPTISTNVVGDVANGEQGSTEQTNTFGTNFAVVYIFALMLMFTAFTTSGYLMQSVVEEKETRMVEVIISSVRPRDLLVGKVLALSVLGLLQMAMWFVAVFIIIRLLTTQTLGGVIPLMGFSLSSGQVAVLVLYFILGYLYFAASYAAIGTLVTNMREGPQMAAIVTLPAAVPLWATSLFAIAPNGPVAVVLSMIPFTAPLAMVMRATLTEIPLIQVVISAGLLAVTVIAIMWLAGRFFRVNILLSGQMPKFKDLVRLVSERG
jgi:ABC-2 type transport system permease protein